MKHQTRVRLNDLDYEDCYAKALTILREKYECVGLPYLNENGHRLCDVETLHADDMTVFMLAWGAEIAHQIAGSEPSQEAEKRPHKKQHIQARSATSGV